MERIEMGTLGTKSLPRSTLNLAPPLLDVSPSGSFTLDAGEEGFHQGRQEGRHFLRMTKDD